MLRDECDSVNRQMNKTRRRKNRRQNIAHLVVIDGAELVEILHAKPGRGAVYINKASVAGAQMNKTRRNAARKRRANLRSWRWRAWLLTTTFGHFEPPRGFTVDDVEQTRKDIIAKRTSRFWNGPLQ